MSGNPLEKSGEQKKNGGLRWNMKKGETSVDVKLYCRKEKGDYAEVDADLEHPETNLLQ
jgi:hypothetical protein